MHNKRQMQQKRHAQYLVFVLIVRDWEIVKVRGCEQGLASGIYNPTRHPVNIVYKWQIEWVTFWKNIL